MHYLRTTTAALFAALCLVAHSAYSGQTLDIGNYNILGTDYDVSLLGDSTIAEQSYDALSPALTFTTVSDATEAVNILLGALGNDYNWSPFCGLCNFKGFRVVYNVQPTSYDYVYGNQNGAVGQANRPREEANAFTFAQFSATSEPGDPEPDPPGTEVPAPAAIPLLLILLSGLAIRRRQKR